MVSTASPLIASRWGAASCWRPYTPRLKAEDYGVVCEVSKADLPARLGLRVEGLNENWDAGVFDLETGRLVKRVAIERGVGYLVLDITRPRRVFIGNLVISDEPALVINVLTLGPSGGKAIVHNPTDDPVQANLRLAEGLLPPAQAIVLTMFRLDR